MYRVRFIGRTFLFCTIAAAVSLGQIWDSDLVAGPRAFPEVTLPKGRVLKFLRLFSADRDVERRKIDLLKETMVGSPDKADQDKVRTPPAANSVTAAPSQREVVVDLDAKYAAQPVRDRSAFGVVADAIAGLSPNRDLRMLSPHRVAIDSKQRIIVTDPPAHAIHVFDFSKKKYFRIQGGDGRRLERPSAVTVDAEDNIYTSDAGSGMILVYDPRGKFLRSFAGRDGEGFLDQPDGIAIDRKTGNIYVSDSPRHLIFVFDQSGRTLARFSTDEKNLRTGFGRRGIDGSTDLVLRQDELILVDGNSCTLRFFDLQGHQRQKIEIFGKCRDEHVQVALDLDAMGNIYVTDGRLNTIHVYDDDGHFLYSFGSSGSARGEFASPSGIRIGSKGLIYVADSRNHRVQVFEIRDAKRDYSNSLHRWLQEHVENKSTGSPTSED